MEASKKPLNKLIFKLSEYSGRQVKRMENKVDLKGELALRNMFVAFSIMLFGFFLLDVSLTTVSVGQTITSIINLIPLI